MTNKAQITRIAMVCHEANRAWCLANGDNTQKTWANAASWQTDSAIEGVEFHIDNPKAGDSASHNNWMKSKKADGWGFGETKDETLKTHPRLVSFKKLPEFQQRKDALFRAIVHALKSDEV